jgi:hypothetical protein
MFKLLECTATFFSSWSLPEHGVAWCAGDRVWRPASALSDFEDYGARSRPRCKHTKGTAKVPYVLGHSDPDIDDSFACWSCFWKAGAANAGSCS